MGETRVVQGVVVQGAAVASPTQIPTGGTQVQPNQEASKTGCKDPIFALLFYVNVLAMVVVAAMYGRDAMSAGASYNYSALIYAALVLGGISLVASGFGLLMLMACPELMIKAGLIFSIFVALVWAIYSFLVLQSILFGCLGLGFFAITLCYVKYVWPRIPFAAINMITAGTAIKANLGVTFFAVFFTLLSVGWLMIWSIAFAGVYEVSCDADECYPNYGILFVLFLSLFFTQQVLQSCVHVTVAGTVGTWWVSPSESGCCSKGVFNSFIRTITTSFGSICFGSLLVAILQALRAIASTARMSDDCALLACLCECIIGCLQSLLEYFNKWAFIYVGVYGFGYIESGKSVMQLFADRGWDAIIADDLVGGAIFLVCIIISLLIGGIAVGYARLDPAFSELTQDAWFVAFFVGLPAGLVVCTILLGTISSAVNTVIVMFADAPQEFQNNHPELSTKMREVWQQFYPSSIQ